MSTRQFIDLSVPLRSGGQEPDPPKIKYIDHKRGALLLGLGMVLCKGKGKSFFSHLRNFFLYLVGKYRITAKDFPNGMGIALEEIKTDTHAGTHLDAPYHFGPVSEGRPSKTIQEIPLEWCYGDGVLLDLTHKKPGEFITVDDIKEALEKINYKIKPYDIVLIRTGQDKYLDNKDYLLFQPGMSREATLYLVEQGVKIIGIDAFGFDRPWVNMFSDYLRTRDKKYLWPAHFAGREKEYCHIEKMGNLDRLPKPFGFKVVCFPINIERAGAGWVRPVAIIEEE